MPRGNLENPTHFSRALRKNNASRVARNRGCAVETIYREMLRLREHALGAEQGGKFGDNLLHRKNFGGKCSGGDLNPHALRHTPLKRTCLPFHHPSGWKSGICSMRLPSRKKTLPVSSLRR